MLLSEGLLKIAKYLFALKLGTVSNQLQKQIMNGTVLLTRKDGSIIQIPDNVDSMEKLPEDLRKQVQQQKRSIVQDLTAFITQVNKILSLCNGKNINLDRNFVQFVYTKATNCGMNIFNKFQMQNVLSIVKQYKEYLQFLDKQLQDYQYFESFQKMQQAVDKYKAKEQIQNKRLSKAQWVKSKGIYKICKYTKYNDLHEIANGSGWCVDHDQHMFNNYGAPYYLVLKNGQIHSLLNFNSFQNKKKKNSNVDDMDQTLADLEVQVMQQDYKGPTKVLFKGNFSCLIPFYSTQLLIDGFEHEQLTQSQINDLLGKAIQNGDDKKFDNILSIVNKTNSKNTTNKFNLNNLIDFISTQSQYQKIMLKIFPKTDESVSDQNHLINSVKLSKKNVVSIMFNAFKKGKPGTTLFARMAKFAQSQPDEYMQSQHVNIDLIKQKDSSNKTLMCYVSFLNQLNALLKLGFQLDKNDCLNIIKNMSSKDQIDKPMLDYLNQNNLIDYDNNLLDTVIKTRKPGIVEYFLKTDLDFSKSMSDGELPIMYVLQNNLQTIFNLFKQNNKILVSQEDNTNPQLLYSIMRSKNQNIISYFLDKTSVDFNQTMYNNMVPIFYVVKQGLKNILNLFMKNEKINKNIQVNGRNLMYWSVQSGNDELIQELCENANAQLINKLYSFGKLSNNTVLTYAINTKNNSAFDKIINNKNTDVNFRTPIENAIVGNNKKAFDKIISDSRFDIKTRDLNNDNALTFAIKNITNNNYQYVEKLVKKSSASQSGLTDQHGYSPLMLAISINMPIEKIKKLFGDASLKNEQKSLSNIYSVIDRYLAVHKNDSNMTSIKQWVDDNNNTYNKAKEKSRTKSKAVNIYDILKSQADSLRYNQFVDYLNNDKNNFDFVNNIDIIQYLSKDATRLQYLDAIFDYLKRNNTIKDVLNKKDFVSSIPVYKTQIRKYFEELYKSENIDINGNKKQARISKFLKSYLS